MEVVWVFVFFTVFAVLAVLFGHDSRPQV